MRVLAGKGAGLKMIQCNRCRARFYPDALLDDHVEYHARMDRMIREAGRFIRALKIDIQADEGQYYHQEFKNGINQHADGGVIKKRW